MPNKAPSDEAVEAKDLFSCCNCGTLIGEYKPYRHCPHCGTDLKKHGVATVKVVPVALLEEERKKRKAAEMAELENFAKYRGTLMRADRFEERAENAEAFIKGIAEEGTAGSAAAAAFTDHSRQVRRAEKAEREKEAAQAHIERFGMERNEAREQVRELEAALLETRKALRAYHEVHDPECRLDHHGLCQEHYLHPADECPTKLAKAALSAYEGNPDA